MTTLLVNSQEVHTCMLAGMLMNLGALPRLYCMYIHIRKDGTVWDNQVDE